jgi:hypothetical protein
MSEQKAEALYGKAPEADEAAHTSQAVPDPGNADSYREWGGLQAGALDSTHLGLWVRITEAGKFRVAGRLTSIQHRASWLTDKALTSPVEELVLGRRHVVVTLDHKYSHTVSDTARVEVRRG